jgi:leader peptidase (prepilin peptidase)/N-methyltransferase
MTSAAPELTFATPLRPRRAAVAGLAAAAVGIGCTAVLGVDAPALLAGVVAAVLVWLAALDLDFRLLPNRIVLPAAVVTLVAQLAIAPRHALEFLLAALGASSFLLVAALIRPGGLGMGDVKLALLVGALLGRSVMLALAIGFGAAGIAGAVLVVVSGRVALTRQLPLGPFLALGAIAALLLGAR